MKKITQVDQLLSDIEDALKHCALWQAVPPPSDAFDSTLPFFLDKMPAEQWLQWVFLPKMRVLIETGNRLPTKISLSPYFEETLPSGTESLLALLVSLDNLLNDQD